MIEKHKKESSKFHFHIDVTVFKSSANAFRIHFFKEYFKLAFLYIRICIEKINRHSLYFFSLQSCTL